MYNLLSVAPFDFGAIFKNFLSKWYWYLALLLFITLLILFFLFKKKKTTGLSSTQKICYTAVLAALATLSNIFDVKISDAWQISLVATVGFISGYLLGGGCGFAVCFIGDLLAGIITPHGAYNPIIAIGTGLWGLIPGLIFSNFKVNKYFALTLSFLLCSVLISGVINTYGIYMMYGTGKTFAYYLALYPLKLATCGANFVVSVFFVRVCGRIFPEGKFAFNYSEVDKSETDTESEVK